MYYFHHDLNCYCFMLLLQLVKHSLLWVFEFTTQLCLFSSVEKLSGENIPVNFVTF